MPSVCVVCARHTSALIPPRQAITSEAWKIFRNRDRIKTIRSLLQGRFVFINNAARRGGIQMTSTLHPLTHLFVMLLC